MKRLLILCNLVIFCCGLQSAYSAGYGGAVRATVDPGVVSKQLSTQSQRKNINKKHNQMIIYKNNKGKKVIKKHVHPYAH